MNGLRWDDIGAPRTIYTKVSHLCGKGSSCLKFGLRMGYANRRPTPLSTPWTRHISKPVRGRASLHSGGKNADARARDELKLIPISFYLTRRRPLIGYYMRSIEYLAPIRDFDELAPGARRSRKTL